MASRPENPDVRLDGFVGLPHARPLTSTNTYALVEDIHRRRVVNELQGPMDPLVLQGRKGTG